MPNGKLNGQLNGSANGALNGSLNGGLNGHADKTVTRAPPQRQPLRRRKTSVLGGLINGVGRLITWYLLFTVFVRCPSSVSKLSDSSPRLCKPYLQARSYVTPYVDPYYQTYVAPQVEKVQPYIDSFDSNVYTPVSTFAKDKYNNHAAYRVAQVQKHLEAEWDRTIRPQLQNAQAWSVRRYNIYLAPSVSQVSDAVVPHLRQAWASCEEIYHLSLLPTYEAGLPYAQKGYTQGHYVVTRIIFPRVHTAKDIGWAFITRSVWPQLRVLYGDNVEPQLVRIRERLGRHRDQQKIESIIDALESDSPGVSERVESLSASITASAWASASASASHSASGWDALNDFWPADAPTTSAEEPDTKTKTRPAEPQLSGDELKEKLNDDLRQWQNKFAVAADKGVEDLEQRVADITKRQSENGIKGHGAALVVQLEETAGATIEKFKKFIKQTVKALPEDASEKQLEDAYEDTIARTRELGLSVKEKAQAVRTWKSNFDIETDNLVRAAVSSTLEVLERVQSLGLQEIGMRWAWIEGVTYKDWKNYHKLRTTLNEWKDEVEAVGAGHEGLRAVHEEAKNVEDAAMASAQRMVSELVRLKDVSKWKIWANDATDDFSDKKVPVRVSKAATDVASNVEKIASQASEAIIGTSETPISQSIVEAPSSIASAAKSVATDISSKLSDSVVGSGSSATENLASKLQEPISQASAKASNIVIGSNSDAPNIVSDASAGVKAKVQEVVQEVEKKTSAAPAAPKQPKVVGGVMAQVLVQAREIVFDDELEDDDAESYSDKIQNVVADAAGRASEISKAVSEALLGPSKTQGSVESATSIASEQYAKALAAASVALYGTEKNSLESATSVASERFAQAVTAASYAIYGTPTPTAIIKTIHVQASSRYDQAIRIANEQYSNAKAQLSELVSGTPKPAHETVLSLIENAYSDSVAVASERLQAALKYSESIKNYAAGPTQGYFESVSSIAASRLSEGLSAASAQFSAKPTPALEHARRQYYEAIGLAHERYSEFLGAASSAVYGPEQGTFESIASVVSGSAASVASQANAGVSGASVSARSVASQISDAAESLASEASSTIIGTEAPWTESVASQASQNWEALIAKASTQVYGKPTPWAESVYSQAGSYGAQATAQAAEQYAAVSALISDLVVGREPDFTESVMSRFASAYQTGIPAVVESVNSYASENYEAASSYASESYDSATSYVASVVSSVFTPPPAIETILSQASEQINQAVESASAAVYGTQKGRAEQAGESAASVYSSLQAKASGAVYGTQAAQDSFAAAAASAQAAISEAIFGTPTPTGFVASATDGAGEIYSSISSVAGEKAADVAAVVSSAIYGPEQGAVESASSRLAAAVEVANSRISELYASASKSAEQAANSISSVVAEATRSVKDEL